MASTYARVAIIFTAATVHAQTAPISYVASVKPNNSPDAHTFTEYYPGGRFSATAVTVRALLRTAYRIQGYQLVGAPARFSTKRYDIAAKAEGEPPPLQAFLGTLLAEQFKLAALNETRELPTFGLAPARNDRRPGPQLVKSDFDCAAYAATPHPLADPARTPVCGMRANSGNLAGNSIQMAELANSLAFFVNRFVVDKTGMAGRFDVKLAWTPEQALTNAANDDTAGLSIFSALQEQLGLKLVSERGPVDVLVVDHAEEPMPQ